MRPRYVGDAWRREALIARLRALEQDHYQHELNRRIGEALSRQAEGEAREEAERMVGEATEAQALVEVSYGVLLEALAELATGKTVREPLTADGESG